MKSSTHIVVALLTTIISLAAVASVPAPAQPAHPDTASGMTPSLTLLTGGRLFFDDDMERTYGGMMAHGLRFALENKQEVQIWLAVLYGRDKGDPFYDSPDFTSGERTKLQAVPVLVGARMNVTEHPRYRVYLGLALEICWIQEEVPESAEGAAFTDKVYRGWGLGGYLSAAPEYRFADGRQALGVEFFLGGSGFSRGSRYASGYSIDLAGLSVQAYYAFDL
jgi:hypothetical protein